MLFLRQQEPYRYQRKPIGQELLTRLYLRLHLLDLCDLRSSSTVLSVSILITPSNPGAGPLESILVIPGLYTGPLCSPYATIILSGGPGGNRTPVRNTFLSTSYNNNFYYNIICYKINHTILYVNIYRVVMLFISFGITPCTLLTFVR